MHISHEHYRIKSLKFHSNVYRARPIWISLVLRFRHMPLFDFTCARNAISRILNTFRNNTGNFLAPSQLVCVADAANPCHLMFTHKQTPQIHSAQSLYMRIDVFAYFIWKSAERKDNANTPESALRGASITCVVCPSQTISKVCTSMD